MKRPPARITPAQLDNLRALSQAQAKGTPPPTMPHEYRKEFEQRLVKSAQDLARMRAWSQRYGHWLARAALVPVGLFALACVAGVLLGLWSGEIWAGRFSKATAVRDHSPWSYGLSVGYHGLLAAFFVWLWVISLRAAKLFRS